MNVIDIDHIRQQAARQHRNAASSGTALIGGKRYLLTFNHKYGTYDVTHQGQPVVSFDTRQLPEARRRLREYLAN